MPDDETSHRSARSPLEPQGPNVGVALALLFGVLLACKSGSEGAPGSTSATTSAALPRPAPPAPPPVSASMAPAAAAPFDGAPGDTVKFLRELPLRRHGLFVRSPVGWTGFEEYYDGLISLQSKDRTAVVLVNADLGKSVSPAQMALWTKSAGGRGVIYGSATRGAVGAGHLPAFIHHGQGKLNGADAEFIALVVEVGPKAGALVVAGLAKNAPAARREEWLACVRSLRKA